MHDYAKYLKRPVSKIGNETFKNSYVQQGKCRDDCFFWFTSVILCKMNLYKYEGVVLTSWYQIIEVVRTIFAGRRYKSYMLNMRQRRTERAVESVTDTGCT